VNDTYDSRQFYRRMGLVIKDARLRREYSQLDLARFMKVSQGSVQFWEAGLRRPSAESIVRMCKVLRVTPEQLLGMEEQ